ncbi:MAG: hypothetical protein GX879_00955, partial [Bacteroidales bacterium]|nr:hypothetical protein [Bacteroidales bacterium]
MFEKKNPAELEKQIEKANKTSEYIQTVMKLWFPDINNHSLWTDKDQFKKIVVKGCWPLHPLSTWILYKMSSVGKTLQQRSAFSFIANIFDAYGDVKWPTGKIILPVELCNEDMVNEFLLSEEYGQQGATAHAYESVIQKYQHELSREQNVLLKAVLLSSKIGFKIESREEYLEMLSLFSGVDMPIVKKEVSQLEAEFAVLEWNEVLNRFDIAGDSVPRKTFIAYLKREADKIDSGTKAEIFSQNYKKWSEKEMFNTDFGPDNDIPTKEWNYNISCASLSLLESQIDYVLHTWINSRGVDEAKGQIIYCYVGPESDIETVKDLAEKKLRSSMEKKKIDLEIGAPVAIILLHDTDGSLGQKVAENLVLANRLGEEEKKKYKNFISDRQNSLEQEMDNLFSQLERQRNIVFATRKDIKEGRIRGMLYDLFDIIYDQRIPFPFDGFSTARGNAAKDCQLFTKELFLGRLDKEWIVAQSQQQRNRAYQVFDESWGILGKDGSIRINPKNEMVMKIIGMLDSKLLPADSGSRGTEMSLGTIVRNLCAPPYGCNLASAGLLLALFIGKRRDEINIIMDEEPIGFDKWLQKALSRRFFELSVLDSSFLKRIDKKDLSQWESFLEEWEDKKQLQSKYEYLIKAENLRKRINIPQQLHYKYKHLQKQSEDAIKKLEDHENKINEALEKVDKGLARGDIGKILSGGAELIDLLEEMNGEKEVWDNKQFEEINGNIKEVKTSIKTNFEQWVSQLSVASEGEVEQLKHKTLKTALNLEKLGFPEKQELLDKRINQLTKDIRRIENINRIVFNIKNMVKSNTITDNTTFSTLNSWIEQTEKFEQTLKLAEQKVSILDTDTGDAARALEKFKQACQEQKSKYKERMRKIFDIQNLSDSSHIGFWREEIAA